MTIKNVTDAEFSANIKTEGITLVDFGAPRCAPCRYLLPILEELDRELGDAVTILQIDADESPSTVSRYKIMSLPTVLLFKDGQPMQQLVGLKPKGVYRSAINELSQ